jgi:hypothetical protein
VRRTAKKRRRSALSEEIDNEIPGSADRDSDTLGHRYCGICDAQAANHRRPFPHSCGELASSVAQRKNTFSSPSHALDATASPIAADRPEMIAPKSSFDPEGALSRNRVLLHRIFAIHAAVSS